MTGKKTGGLMFLPLGGAGEIGMNLNLYGLVIRSYSHNNIILETEPESRRRCLDNTVMFVDVNYFQSLSGKH